MAGRTKGLRLNGLLMGGEVSARMERLEAERRITVVGYKEGCHLPRHAPWGLHINGNLIPREEVQAAGLGSEVQGGGDRHTMTSSWPAHTIKVEPVKIHQHRVGRVVDAPHDRQTGVDHRLCSHGLIHGENRPLLDVLTIGVFRRG